MFLALGVRARAATSSLCYQYFLLQEHLGPLVSELFHCLRNKREREEME